MVCLLAALRPTHPTTLFQHTKHQRAHRISGARTQEWKPAAQLSVAMACMAGIPTSVLSGLILRLPLRIVLWNMC